MIKSTDYTETILWRCVRFLSNWCYCMLNSVKEAVSCRVACSAAMMGPQDADDSHFLAFNGLVETTKASLQGKAAVQILDIILHRNTGPFVDNKQPSDEKRTFLGNQLPQHGHASIFLSNKQVVMWNYSHVGRGKHRDCLKLWVESKSKALVALMMKIVPNHDPANEEDFFFLKGLHDNGIVEANLPWPLAHFKSAAALSEVMGTGQIATVLITTSCGPGINITEARRQLLPGYQTQKFWLQFYIFACSALSEAMTKLKGIYEDCHTSNVIPSKWPVAENEDFNFSIVDARGIMYVAASGKSRSAKAQKCLGYFFETPRQGLTDRYQPLLLDRISQVKVTGASAFSHKDPNLFITPITSLKLAAEQCLQDLERNCRPNVQRPVIQIAQTWPPLSNAAGSCSSQTGDEASLIRKSQGMVPKSEPSQTEAVVEWDPWTEGAAEEASPQTRRPSTPQKPPTKSSQSQSSVPYTEKPPGALQSELNNSGGNWEDNPWDVIMEPEQQSQGLVPKSEPSQTEAVVEWDPWFEGFVKRVGPAAAEEASSGLPNFGRPSSPQTRRPSTPQKPPSSIEKQEAQSHSDKRKRERSNDECEMAQPVCSRSSEGDKPHLVDSSDPNFEPDFSADDAMQDEIITTEAGTFDGNGETEMNTFVMYLKRFQEQKARGSGNRLGDVKSGMWDMRIDKNPLNKPEFVSKGGHIGEEKMRIGRFSFLMIVGILKTFTFAMAQVLKKLFSEGFVGKTGLDSDMKNLNGGDYWRKKQKIHCFHNQLLIHDVKNVTAALENVQGDTMEVTLMKLRSWFPDSILKQIFNEILSWTTMTQDKNSPEGKMRMSWLQHTLWHDVLRYLDSRCQHALLDDISDFVIQCWHEHLTWFLNELQLRAAGDGGNADEKHKCVYEFRCKELLLLGTEEGRLQKFAKFRSNDFFSSWQSVRTKYHLPISEEVAQFLRNPLSFKGKGKGKDDVKGKHRKSSWQWQGSVWQNSEWQWDSHHQWQNSHWPWWQASSASPYGNNSWQSWCFTVLQTSGLRSTAFFWPQNPPPPVPNFTWVLQMVR